MYIWLNQSIMTKEEKQVFQDFDLVIFGGDGDLSFRKIFPALYHRLNEYQISERSRIIAVSRKEKGQDEFLVQLESNLRTFIENIDETVLNKLLAMVSFGMINTGTNQQNEAVDAWFSKSQAEVRVFYLATPAVAFGPIASYLNQKGYISKQSRVVLEKPLGTDLESSERINDLVAEHFDEEQVYRIDHYLGKETVQNLMVLRFANNIFESSWNARDIEDIQITVAESIGVGTRGAFYDQYGALRDMVQNHLLQLLCLIAMEPPAVLDADEVRDEKLKVLKSLRPYDAKTIKSHTIRGQYTRGKTGEGSLPSYLEDIEKYDSESETFVAIKTYIDNWRGGGVPI